MNNSHQPHRIALAFDICTESDGLVDFSRPQDFRVKRAHWRYWTGPVKVLAPNGQPVEYEIHAYARRWLGKGDNFTQLEHDQHPTPDEIEQMVMDMAGQMKGFPIRGDGHSEPVAWVDPLREDDFLDENDNPKDFDFVADSNDDDDFEDINMAGILSTLLPDSGEREADPDPSLTIRPTKSVQDKAEARPKVNLPIEAEAKKVVSQVMSDQSPLPVTISIMQAWLLVSGLQLTCRHPGISPYMKKALTDVARQFQAAIVEQHPQAGDVIEAGWWEEFDQ